MSHPSAVSGVFGKPFAEQIAFFRNKLGNRVPTRRWDDLQGAAHDQAFMVAGAIEADLLTDLAAAVDKAISEGRGIDSFRKDFKAIVAKNGWTGWTGEGSVVGEAWRVKTILRTNAYTSYSAGRHAQLVAGEFAFWVYRHGDSVEPRIVHLSWNGIALEPGHVFWVTHYPPSEWGCSCFAVGARSAAGVRRLGGDPDKKLPANWNKIDPKTGAPIGIGRGWNYAPGASVARTVNALADKVGKWDQGVAKAFLSSLPVEQADALSQAYRALPSTADDARRFAQAVADDREPLANPAVRTMGPVQSAVARDIEPLVEGALPALDYSMTQGAVRDVLAKRGGAATDDFAVLPLVLLAPDSVEPVTDENGEVLVRMIRLLRGTRYAATFALNRDQGTLSLRAFGTAGEK